MSGGGGGANPEIAEVARADLLDKSSAIVAKVARQAAGR